jgi:signal transduction histidine kinase
LTRDKRAIRGGISGTVVSRVLALWGVRIVPSLFVIQGGDQGKRFELDEREMTLGRDSSNRVQLHDTEVSRRHAELKQVQDGYLLVDLHSSNGTYVNSTRIDQRILQSGDRVQIGRTLMIYTGPDDWSAENLAEAVNIVGQAHDEGGSRIIRSIRGEDGSRIFQALDTAESPWLARARSNLQIMYRTALAVSHTLDIDQLLSRIMEMIFEWVEADRGCIMLVERESDELVPKVRRYRRAVPAGEKMKISRTILDYVRANQEGVLTSDAQEDARWSTGASIVKLGVREAICVPMQGRYGVVGIIYIDTYTPPGQYIQRPGRDKFTDEHLKLMVAIGHQAALAIEDTSYYSAMVQAERLAAIGQTIASLSHHIKNILQGIRGGSYLIEEGLTSNEADVVRAGWKIVEKNQERISNLVMDMLTFSKERQPEMAPSDINQVVAEVVELMQVRAAEGGVQLTTRLATDIPTLTFDAEGLHRAILNVVTNAIDACESRPAARVCVTTRYQAADRQLEVEVEDTGEGISPEDVKRIFTVFESRKGHRGTGLGLPVSQKILREHGGDIRVASQVGAGSCFTLHLPAVLPEAVASAPQAFDTSSS